MQRFHRVVSHLISSSSSFSSRDANILLLAQRYRRISFHPSITSRPASTPIIRNISTVSAGKGAEEPVMVTASTTSMNLDNSALQDGQGKEELPKLSLEEFRRFNRMATTMEYYHNNFRHTWNTLYAAVDTESTSAGSRLSAPRIVQTGLSFVGHLTVHHDIEEEHIFPVLAERMPGFRPGSFAMEQHKQIHAGMDELEAYLNQCRRGERELRREEVKQVMDGFGTVLWTHLEEEVKELGAENMRKFWTAEEISRMPL